MNPIDELKKLTTKTCQNCVHFTKHPDQNRWLCAGTPKYVIPGDASECLQYQHINKNGDAFIIENEKSQKVTPTKNTKKLKIKIGTRKVKY